MRAKTLRGATRAGGERGLEVEVQRPVILHNPVHLLCFLGDLASMPSHPCMFCLTLCLGDPINPK